MAIPAYDIRRNFDLLACRVVYKCVCILPEQESECERVFSRTAEMFPLNLSCCETINLERNT